MSEKEAVKFLIAMAEEVKRSFEVPVILVTMKDYGDKIFNNLVEIRRALLMKSPKSRFAELINNIHVQWLEAVADVEDFKNRLYSIPHDMFYKSIEYTIKCVQDRFKYFKQYIKFIDLKMDLLERNQLHTELEITADMCKSVVTVIKGKQKCFEQLSDRTEYTLLVTDEINELLHWIDTLTDNVLIQLNNVFTASPELLKDLAKVSYDLAGKVADTPFYGDIKSIEGIHRTKATHDLEMLKLSEKIKAVNDKITEIKIENPEQALELQRLDFKAGYINERLHRLQSIKESLNTLGESRFLPSVDDVLQNKVTMFKHMLPSKHRYNLVEKLLKVWNAVIHGDSLHKSIVCILSPTDMKEMYTDDIGNFMVDRYSRKLYIIPDDERYYQLNENSELVLVDDDEDHIYYYDACGRYYKEDETDIRIYKAHRTASEYILHNDGKLAKVKEEKAGVVYYFDSVGRYRLENDTQRVYHNEGSESEYEDDGLGNLVRRRTEFPLCEPCPLETTYTSESTYLKQTVGDALRKCIAKTIMKQPRDPIRYLADCLEDYLRNKEENQRLKEEETAMFEERKMYAPETTVLPSEVYMEPEESDTSFTDYNLLQYKSAADELL